MAQNLGREFKLVFSQSALHSQYKYQAVRIMAAIANFKFHVSSFTLHYSNMLRELVNNTKLFDPHPDNFIADSESLLLWHYRSAEN